MREDAAIIVYESTSSVQPKCKPKILQQDLSKVSWINPSTMFKVVYTQEFLIASTNTMMTLESKLQKIALGLNLIELYKRHKTTNIGIDETVVLIEEELT